jgi:type IV pilus assembly protein PilQ
MMKGFLIVYLIVVSIAGAFSQEIKSVNFVQEGEISKLIIETDQDNTLAERFHVTEDKQIILDLKDIRVDSRQLRGIDTSEFPGSTVFISGYKKPGTKSDVRFAVQLRDNVRSILENKGKSVILNIENRFGVFSQKKLSRDEPSGGLPSDKDNDVIGLNVPKSNSVEDILENISLSGPKKYIGKRISINVKEIPIPDLLNMIADTSGFNIIIDQSVPATPLTLTLTNVPWDQALDTVMGLSKLVAQKNTNILIIKTLEMANKEKQEELVAKKLKETLEPTVTRVFLINYATLGDIQKIIQDYITKDRGSIQTDSRTNSLIVKDTLDSIERIKKIIETLDTQTPQVLIEAKIVEASEGYRKRIGLNRGITFGYDPFRDTSTPSVGPGFSFSTAPNAELSTVLGMSIGIYKRLVGLDFNLQLAESESKARVISSPRIVTQNKKAATITSSETTSFRVQQPATGNQPAIATFQPVAANLTLNVTPQVTNDGAISLTVAIAKGSFGTRPTTDAPPDQTNRNIDTNVLVDNGSTVVIGGLYQTGSSETVSGIPLLKDLPLIGWIFRSPNSIETEKKELIIFLTPRIMNQEESGLSERQASSSEKSKEL